MKLIQLSTIASFAIFATAPGVSAAGLRAGGRKLYHKKEHESMNEGLRYGYGDGRPTPHDNDRQYDDYDYKYNSYGYGIMAGEGEEADGYGYEAEAEPYRRKLYIKGEGRYREGERYMDMNRGPYFGPSHPTPNEYNNYGNGSYQYYNYGNGMASEGEEAHGHGYRQFLQAEREGGLP